MPRFLVVLERLTDQTMTMTEVPPSAVAIELLHQLLVHFCPRESAVQEVLHVETVRELDRDTVVERGILADEKLSVDGVSKLAGKDPVDLLADLTALTLGFNTKQVVEAALP